MNKQAHWPNSPSIASVMQELRDFRKNHPAPPPPDKPAPRQKRNGHKK